jgi:hypothetical protein
VLVLDSIQQIDYGYEHHFIEHEHEITNKVVVFGEKSNDLGHRIVAAGRDTKPHDVEM